jgi:hypothetical protein
MHGHIDDFNSNSYPTFGSGRVRLEYDGDEGMSGVSNGRFEFDLYASNKLTMRIGDLDHEVFAFGALWDTSLASTFGETWLSVNGKTINISNLDNEFLGIITTSSDFLYAEISYAANFSFSGNRMAIDDLYALSAPYGYSVGRGDLTAIPIPSSLWLFISAIFSLSGVIRYNKSLNRD